MLPGVRLIKTMWGDSDRVAVMTCRCKEGCVLETCTHSGIRQGLGSLEARKGKAARVAPSSRSVVCGRPGRRGREGPGGVVGGGQGWPGWDPRACGREESDGKGGGESRTTSCRGRMRFTAIFN